jgi:hypothetical protein
VRRIVTLVGALALGGLVACGTTKPADGTPGTAGTSGSAGSGGTAGTEGAAGTSGDAGTTDAAATGAAGDSGASGSSGAAGTGAAGTGAAGTGAAGTGAAGTGAAGTGVTACTPVAAQHPDEGAFHVACTPVPTYGTKPPSSGNHYAIWADYKTYDKPVPWGHLMHSMEHGAVVIVYNCPSGCPTEVAAAQAMIDTLPLDAGCTAPTKRRVILAPDPTLDVRWAASAWTWTLRASCFDAPAFKKFATDHYAKTAENFCDELHEPLCALP